MGQPTSSGSALRIDSGLWLLLGRPNCFSTRASRCCCSLTVSASARNDSPIAASVVVSSSGSFAAASVGAGSASDSVAGALVIDAS